MNRQAALAIAGYVAFFFVWFLLFAYWTFPYDRVTVAVANAVEKSGVGYSVDIGDLSPYWLTGVEVEDVQLYKLGAPAPVDGEKAEPSMRVREARVRLGILPLLWGNRAFGFDAELEQGEIEGEFEQSGDEKNIEATLSKIDLGKVGILSSLIPLPVQGELGGNIDLALAAEPAKSSGKAELTMKGIVIGDGKAKLKMGAMGGLTIDPIAVGNVTIELDVKDGIGTVKKLSADGKDVELEGSGDVRFADPLSRSRIDILLRIKFTDAYRNKSDRTKAMFSLLDSSSVSQLRAAKTPDGSLQYRLSGSMAAMRAIPSGRARPKGAAPAGHDEAASPRRPPRPVPRPMPVPDMPEEETEDEEE